MLHQGAVKMAKMIRRREISSVELVTAHLTKIQEVNAHLNAVVHLFADSALRDAKAADEKLASGARCGPLHGVPFSVKDSIDVKGSKCTAGTLGRRNASAAENDAVLVSRLRAAGGIPIAKTNLPDLLFSFETDNLLHGRTNNPYDPERTPGGSSGGESALIAACGSPLGLGSDCFGSVRIPAAFCGIAGIKPTSGRLPRTGHLPPAGGWISQLWQIGPMARRVEDLIAAMELLAGEDTGDFACPPMPLIATEKRRNLRIAFFTDNGFRRCSSEIERAVRRCADFLSETGMQLFERRAPGVEQAYELELAITGADGGDGIDAYLQDAGSIDVHPLLTNFLSRMRPFRSTAAQLSARWAQWDEYRLNMLRFFDEFDAILCPVYTRAALKHGESALDENFEGFSYTMAWNLAGAPAATVRCGEAHGLPINIQVIAKPWRDLLALEICRVLETEFGGA